MDEVEKMVSSLKRAADLLFSVEDPRAVSALDELEQAISNWDDYKKHFVMCDLKGSDNALMLPFGWCNADQISMYTKKNQGTHWTTFAGAKFAGSEHLMGYPMKTYHFPNELEIDDFKIKNIVQPKGGKSLGQRWWYNPVSDPEAWWKSYARPIYESMYRAQQEKSKKEAIEEMVAQTKEAIEQKEFPWTLKS